MREIKFRYWDTFNQEMSEYDPYLAASVMANPSEDCPLMQYTGLKDKNNVEIYEGDIIFTKLGRYYLDNHYVRWFIASWYLFNNRGMLGRLDEFDYLEVIGNIYENSELLK